MTDGPVTRRWDPMVKLTHWSIVLAVLANAVITEEGSAGHVWVGYALAVILGLRLLWGFVGPAEARFSAFPPSPARALAHVRDIAAVRHEEYRSHNPLGALMAYAIWGTLLVIIASGISMAQLPGIGGGEQRPAVAVGTGTAIVSGNDEEGREGETAEHGEGGERNEAVAEEVHEAAVNLLYLLILLHLAGVVFESRRQRRNLALAMIPGRR